MSFRCCLFGTSAASPKPAAEKKEELKRVASATSKLSITIPDTELTSVPERCTPNADQVSNPVIEDPEITAAINNNAPLGAQAMHSVVSPKIFTPPPAAVAAPDDKQKKPSRFTFN